MTRWPFLAMAISALLLATVLFVRPASSQTVPSSRPVSTPATAVTKAAITSGPGAGDPKWTDVGTFVVGAIGLLVVGVGLGYGAMQLRLVHASTTVDTMSSFANRWDSALLIRARQFLNVNNTPGQLTATLKWHEDVDTYDYYAVTALIGFFEELGYLCRLGDGPQREPVHATIRDYVVAIFRHPVLTYYPMLEEHILDGRCNEAQFADYFMQLHELMKSGA